MKLHNNYVPHIVDMPQPTFSFREKLNIPEDKIIIGRHGGYTEFDLPFVYSAIHDTLKKRDDIYFVFMNTRPFMERHPNVIHIEGTCNMQHKSNYINTCDYMLHGRYMGESFGLALSEFLFHGKPVIAWTGGQDQNHREILKDEGLWYNTKDDLTDLLCALKKENNNASRYKNLVSEFAPEKVMRRFNEMFLI